jgi:exopolysaccharide biosynthesis protein
MRIDNRYAGRKSVEQHKILHKQPVRRGKPVALAILADVFAAALLLSFFYVTNYVLTPDVVGVPLSTPFSAAGASAMPPATASASNTGNEQSPAPTSTEQQTTAPAASSPAQPATLREKFTDKFTAGEVVKTDTSYKSANVNVSINKVHENGVTYFVADIYVADIKYLKTGFGSTGKLGAREFVDATLKANGGIIGINGDNCLNNPCLLIRNGIYYPKFTKTSSDALVMYNDGTMKTIPSSQFDMNHVKAESPYQVWGFGPMLLDNGKPMTKFNSSLSGTNPRTAMGYYEPGHYCFVVVDGRQAGYSNGYTLADLSQLFYKLGCTAAFNFDGGGSTQMAFMGNRINKPCSDYRKTYDLVYISDN